MDCDCQAPNYGHLHRDEESGLQFIIQIGTMKRLYKMPPCRICGIAQYSLSNAVREECGSCRPDRVERNDNEEPSLVGAAE
jgi:hypothetical protein